MYVHDEPAIAVPVWMFDTNNIVIVVFGEGAVREMRHKGFDKNEDGGVLLMKIEDNVGAACQ